MEILWFNLRFKSSSFSFQLHQLIARHQRSRYHNYCALTILHGSNTFKFFSEDHRRLAYQYQNQDINYMSDNFHYEVNEKESPTQMRLLGPTAIKQVKIRPSINDNLEWFNRRILDFGINHRDLSEEVIETFHYELLNDDQLKELKNSIAKYNENLPFFKRLYAYHSMEEANLNEKYLQYICKRYTIYGIPQFMY